MIVPMAEMLVVVRIHMKPIWDELLQRQLLLAVLLSLNIIFIFLLFIVKKSWNDIVLILQVKTQNRMMNDSLKTLQKYCSFLMFTGRVGE